MGMTDRPVISNLQYANEQGLAQLFGSLGEAGFQDVEALIAKGLATGASGLAPGYRSVSATTIVPMHASAYTEAPAASNLEVVSSSAQDAAAGTGTRTARVTYYRDDGGGVMSGPYTVDITMNGTTPVAIGDSAARFVESVVSLTVGSNGTNVGTITIRRADDTSIGTIVVGDGRTFWAHHYIASSRVGFIRRITLGAVSNALLSTFGSLFFVRSTRPMTANSFEKQETPSLRCREDAVSASFDFDRSLWVPGPARITLHARPDAATAGTVHGGISFCDI